MTEETFEDWFNALSPSDRALWATLDETKRQAARIRVETLLAQQAGRLSIAQAAAELRQTESSYFALRRKWRDRGGLHSVVPYLGRSARRSFADTVIEEAEGQDGQQGARALLVGEAQRLIREHPEKTNGYIARKLRGTPGYPATPNAASRLVRTLRRRNRMDPDKLREGFGSRINVDMTALAMLIETRDGLQPAVLHFVMERASGLVMGHAVTVRGHSRGGPDAAVATALEFAERHRLDVELERTPTVMTVCPGERSKREMDAFTEEVTGPNAVVTVVTGDRRFGISMSMIGARIKHLELRPSSTTPGSGLPTIRQGFLKEPVTLEDAKQIVDAEIEAWNMPIIDRIASAGIGANTDGQGGSITKALEAARGLLERLED